MMNKGKKIISMSLATLIVIGSNGIYAAGFKDIASNYWAKSYIDRGSKLGLFKGYDDGTFKPTNNISRVETISLVSRMLGLSESEIKSLKEKYLDILIKNNVPDWAYGDFAIAISKDIIDISTLTPQFIYNDKNAYNITTREEICIYLVRAMGLENEVKNMQSAKLSFNDANKVHESLVPYVKILVDKGVISGNDKNEFNPKNSISRAEVAKVLTSAYDYIQNNKKEEVVVPPVTEKTFTVNGTIFAIRSLNNGKTYIDISINNNIETYEVNNNTSINLGYEKVNLSALSKGMNIKAEIIDNSKESTKIVKAINSEDKIEEYKGTIDSLREGTITIKENNNLGSTKVFTIDSDTIITLDDKKASLKDLKTQDIVTIKMTNNKLDSIDAKGKYRDIEGIIRSIDYKLETISIEDKDGNRKEYDIAISANIKKDKRNVKLESIKVGDKASLFIEDGIVKTIEAETVVSYIEGIIKSLNISSDKSTITIVNNDNGKEEKYDISKTTSLTLDGNKANIYQLEINFYLKLRVEGIEVTDIEGRTRNIINSRIGTIERIGRDYLEVRVPVDNYKDEIITVEITKSTNIISDDGRIVDFDSLERFDEVVIKGDYYGKDIIAKSIIVSKYRK